MTKNEAIELLKLDRAMANFNPITGEEMPMNEENAKSVEALDMAIEALQDRPQGKWIRRSSVGNWECSLCGCDVIATEQKFANYNYCPNCGARMESDE